MYALSFWEDKVKHKESLIVFSYLLIAIGCLGYIFVDSQFKLLVVQVVLGFAIALLSPAYDALYSHYVNRKTEASDWGLWESMGHVVGAFAALIGGYVASWFGFKVLFLVMFFAALLGVLTGLNLYRRKRYLNKQARLFSFE